MEGHQATFRCAKEPMRLMLTVFVAICLAGTPVQDCNRDTALDWLVAPERQMGFGACLIHGQQYAAESNLAMDGAYLKVFCRWGGDKNHDYAEGQ